MATVRLEQVSLSYWTRGGPVLALDDLDLTTNEGELLVLLGPSGCGKTSLLRVIAGLETVAQGRVWIDERDATALEPRERDVAMVFQNYALYPHLSVFQNLAFALKRRRLSKAEVLQRVAATAAQLGLEPLLDRKPGTLSGGEQQRVAVGRAIVRDPRLLLLDEPLSNVDAMLRSQMRADIKALHRRLGVTTIYVTHDQEEALTLGDRIAVMNRGRVEQCETPLEVYNRPRNCFVASFVGMPRMNFLEGRLKVGPRGVEVAGTWGTLPLADSMGARHNVPSAGRVIVGLRPEHVFLRAGEATTPTSRPAGGIPTVAPPTDFVDAAEWAPLGRFRVVLLEPVGDRTRVHVRSAAGTSLVASVNPAGAPPVGSEVEVLANIGRLHLFEADGKRNAALLR